MDDSSTTGNSCTWQSSSPPKRAPFAPLLTASAVSLSLNLGLEPSLTEDYAAWVEDRAAAGFAGMDPAKLPDYEGDDAAFSLVDEEGQVCTLDIEYGDGWFRVNGSR